VEIQVHKFFISMLDGGERLIGRRGRDRAPISVGWVPRGGLDAVKAPPEKRTVYLRNPRLYSRLQILVS
jgi:hypothetical protein